MEWICCSWLFSSCIFKELKALYEVFANLQGCLTFLYIHAIDCAFSQSDLTLTFHGRDIFNGLIPFLDVNHAQNDFHSNTVQLTTVV